MITNPWFYVLAVPAIMLIGVSKSGFGGALGGLAVPLLALTIPPPDAAAILLPILCVMDIVGLRYFTSALDSANLRIILPGALIGIAVGTLCFGLLDEGWLLLLVGSIGVGFALLNWSGLARRAGPSGPSVPKGLTWSSIAGFTSFVCHSGGPPLLVYLMPQRLEKKLFVGTTVLFFLVVNYVKLVPYWYLGQLRLGNLSTSLILLPLAPAGVYLGIWLQKRMQDKTVYRLANVCLFVTGSKLIYDGVTRLAALY